jgi:hypothetical protein
MNKNNVFGDMDLSQLNDAIKAEINSVKDGDTCKFAAESGNSYIRMQLFEEGFARRIMPAQPVDYSELNQFFDETLGMIIEVEPTQTVSASVPFDAAQPTLHYFAPKAGLFFYDIKTPKFQKNIKLLNSYKMDLRKIMMDNALKSMSKQEDFDMIQLLNSCTSAGGVEVTFKGGLNRNTVVEMAKIMQKQNLPQGVCLLNNSTFLDFCKLGRNAWGGDGAQENLVKGPEAIKEASLMGLSFISTSKADLVNDNVCYMVTQPDFLGRFAELEKPVMYVKREQDRITMEASETIGMTIVNTRGVAKIKFFGEAASANTPYPIPFAAKQA